MIMRKLILIRIVAETFVLTPELGVEKYSTKSERPRAHRVFHRTLW